MYSDEEVETWLNENGYVSAEEWLQDSDYGSICLIPPYVDETSPLVTSCELHGHEWRNVDGYPVDPYVEVTNAMEAIAAYEASPEAYKESLMEFLQYRAEKVVG